MRWPERWTRRLLFGVFLALGVAYPAVGATSAELRVDGSSVAKSPVLQLAVTDELRVELNEPVPPDVLVSVFVHAVSGELVCRDDADAVADVFRCRPPTAGSYYVVVQNTSGVAVTALIRTERVRSAPSPRAEYATIGVFFATNREPALKTYFGSDPASNVSYGYSQVSIPRDHRLGELEGPSILRLELRADPEKHVKVLKVQVEAEQRFFELVSRKVDLSKARDALVFVHGFNVTFEDALRRTAQISYDLGFDGAPILFSWPSQGSAAPLGYQRDVRNADLAAELLYRILEQLTHLRPGIRVHVIAHSMGNRVLAPALERLAQTTHRVQQVALMAPDLDADLFRQVAPAIAQTAQRVTLYASSEDLALSVSQAQAGYRRAGQAGSDIVVLPGVDTIDASGVDTSMLGLRHGYYADNATIVSDLFWLLRDKGPTERFRLVPVRVSAGTYWRFLPAAR
jgi:esterase/lipase superfamily enzyme